MFKVSFDPPDFAPVELEPGVELFDALDGPHSPVFFGCKSGNCGTCLIQLSEESFQSMPPPSEEERDLLDAFAPGKPFARLACQVRVSCDLKIRCGLD